MSVVEQERTIERTVTDADVLERAADLLGEFGWCQHSAGITASGEELALCDFPEGDPVAFCYSGAIWRAARDLNWTPPPRFVSSADIYWNDSPLRTKAEVVAKLREAAARARSAA